jgi:epsilon-lactone hydrolase
VRLSARLVATYLRRHVKPRLLSVSNLSVAKEIIEALPGLASPTCAASEPLATPAASLLYLHGGAYFCGAPEHYRRITQFFAAQGFDVIAPAYRLAPAHPFPAALDDARAAYDALLAKANGPVVLAGDSAGGGLALALMISLRDQGQPLPRAAALFSPWTDLAVAGASARENENRDALFSRRMLKAAALAYLAGTSSRHPLASPFYAPLAGLPPLLLHVGTAEILRDDSLRLAKRARGAGVSVELDLWPNVPHCWQLMLGIIPEADASLEKAAAFLWRHAAGRTEGTD